MGAKPNNGRKKIVILICYFGKLPWYFEYFVHSCKFNPEIDFLIITDDSASLRQVPDNITFVQKTLNEISAIATKRFNFPVNIRNPYKLCDFKPAYGFLFPNLVRGYDFWGHGDLDVIYGNIRKFITAKILREFDLISVRHDYITGHFALFRNCKKLNSLFMKSKDFVKVFSEERSFCFDETNYAFDAFTHNVPLDKIVTEVESMTHVAKKMASENYLKAYFDFHIIEGLPGKLKWVKGKLTYKNRFEAMMYHLIALKTVYQPNKVPSTLQEKFRISTTRIYF